MADEVKTEVKAQPDEAIKNLKAEFDRKLGNLEKGNEALLNQLKQLAKPPAPKKEAPTKTALKDLWYDDPESAAAAITKSAKEETLAAIQEQNVIQQKRGNTIQQLYREYPELQDYDHPLTAKAIELFDKFSDEEKSNPIAYRLAVKEAAEELDVKPKARRKAKDEDDSFSLGSGSKGGEGGGTRSRKGGLDPRTVKFAELVGLNVKDEKTLERIKGRAERKNWMTWE